MKRRVFHLLMAVACVLCVASLIETSLTRSIPCAICGRRTEFLGSVGRMSADHMTVVTTMHAYRCNHCQYEILTAAPVDDAMTVPQSPEQWQRDGR
jgi:DNA-directed RNA polymerase subunit RPC12/RpoP